MRPPPPDFDPTVKAALDAAKERIVAGDAVGALEIYRGAWDAATARGDHAHASVIAHMAAIAETDPRQKLRWNVDALREADAAGGHPLVATFYPSLYSNLAFSYVQLGDNAEALRYMELAASRLGDLEPGPYGDRVRSTVETQLTALRSRSAVDVSRAVRPARPTDAASIARVHIRTWQVGYRGQLPDPFLDGLTADLERRTSFWSHWIATEAAARGQTVLVAEDGDEIAGFASFGPSEPASADPTVGELYTIYVDPDRWGGGYGRALIAAAMRRLRGAGFPEAVLWVLETNARARRFYEIAGWSADGGTKTERRGEVELREVRYRRAL